MSNRRLLLLITLLITALAAMGALWFLDHFERVYEEERTGQSPEAIRNPYLAAERFLVALDAEADSVKGRELLLEPPEVPGLLFVSRFGPDLTEEREAALLTWMRAGGHLAMVATETWDDEEETSHNRLLDRFGVRYHNARGVLASILKAADGDKDEGKGQGDDQEEVQATLPEDLPPARWVFRRHRSLSLHGDQTPVWRVDGDSGAHLLQFAIGTGRLTVLSDAELLTNRHIGEHDHIQLLVQLAGDLPQAWFIYGTAMPGVPALLFRHAPWLTLSIALFLGLWLWSLTRRSGPLLAYNDTHRRNLLEHLDAAGAFAWAVDRAQTLFAANREAIDQRWRRRHPRLQRLPAAARAEWLGQQTGLAPRAVDFALHGEIEGPHDLVRATRTLQRLVMAARPGGTE